MFLDSQDESISRDNMCVLVLRKKKKKKTLSNLAKYFYIKSTAISHDILTSRECRDVTHVVQIL